MDTRVKEIKYTVDAEGAYVLAGYEWITFSSLSAALKWRKRNHKLRVACDLDKGVQS